MLSDQEKIHIAKLVNGEVMPTNGFEIHFLRSVKGDAIACTQRERMWYEYVKSINFNEINLPETLQSNLATPSPNDLKGMAFYEDQEVVDLAIKLDEQGVTYKVVPSKDGRGYEFRFDLQNRCIVDKHTETSEGLNASNKHLGPVEKSAPLGSIGAALLAAYPLFGLSKPAGGNFAKISRDIISDSPPLRVISSNHESNAERVSKEILSRNQSRKLENRLRLQAESELMGSILSSVINTSTVKAAGDFAWVESQALAPTATKTGGICPRCGGDGGVNGGCSRCDGSGWI